MRQRQRNRSWLRARRENREGWGWARRKFQTDAQKAAALLIAAAPDLLEAALALEKAEAERDDDCEECGGEGEPEACGKCFPAFDDARVKRRLAIAKATGGAK